MQIPITLLVVKNTPAKLLYGGFGLKVTDEYKLIARCAGNQSASEVNDQKFYYENY